MVESHSPLSTPIATPPTLKCLDCSAGLEKTPAAVVCPNCKQSWPVKDGIPRFFQPLYYWGEVEQQYALSFLDEARQCGWHEAAVRRLKGNPDLLSSVIDERRIAWFPLLGLGADSVALDIGSGYGAITHALATAVGEVYSLEAMPERIEFTRLRLTQERILNVHQIQGTALDPPFYDKTFDLIVVNGVLEWVGEWDQNGSPREVQLRFLRKLAGLLKDNGVLVIGIENRFGYWLFRGGIDHSGLPYTSLMPRKVASLCMRYVRRKHYRTTLNPKREYRTYTYSERGYRKLLREGGFGKCQFYWSDPGYNQPYSLVPLQEFAIRDHLLSKLSEPSQVWRGGLRQWVKNKLNHESLLRPVITDFVIFAEPSSDSAPVCRRLLDQLRASLPQVRISAQSECMLYANRKKGLIRVFDRKDESVQFVLKATTPPAGDEELLRTELHNLELVSGGLASQSGPTFSVPEPMGYFQIGRFTYTVESAAAGEQFSRLLFLKPARRRFPYLVRKLPRCVEVAVEIAQLMRANKEVHEMDPTWWQLPKAAQLPVAPEIRRLLDDDWVQHGDFTIENIFLEPATGKMTVIDWEHVVRGLPPLYDVFSLLLSTLPAVLTEKGEASGSSDGWEAHFLTAFFGKGASASLFRDLLGIACNRLQVPPAAVWEMFLQFLVLRIQYYVSRESGHRELHAKFLELALQHAGDFALADKNALSATANATLTGRG